MTCLTRHISSDGGFQNLKLIAIQNETFRRKKVTKKILVGCKNLQRMCRPSKRSKTIIWSKITSLTHHIRSECGFRNLRLIAIQNKTFRRKKVTKKILVWCKNLQMKRKLQNGRKRECGKKGRV